jgi:Spy/CpxP family protein refolding chaperone
MISEVIAGQGGTASAARWWNTTAMQQELRLTATQVSKLDEIFQRGLTERLALGQKIEEMDRLLERIVQRGNADEASVARLSEQVEALRAQENIRHTLILFAVYRTLTREQRVRFTEIRLATR